MCHSVERVRVSQHRVKTLFALVARVALTHSAMKCWAALTPNQALQKNDSLPIHLNVVECISGCGDLEG